MNSSNSTSKFRLDLYDEKFIAIPILGVVANFICIINFITIIRKSNNSIGNMFKYLLVKSVCDLFILSFDVTLFLCLDENKKVYSTYFVQVFNLFFEIYLYYVVAFISCYSEILATLDCLFMLNQKFELFKRSSTFYLLIIFLIVFSIVFYLPEPFRIKIAYISPGEYVSITTELGKSKIFHYYSFVHVLLRDLIPFLSLIIINILILIYLREATRRRRALSSGQSTSMVNSAETAERNKVKMILFTSIIYLFHIPSIFLNLNLSSLNFRPYLLIIVILSLDFSFGLTIIPYTLFNHNFRKNLYRFIMFIFRR
jgi:hypothetical protein